MLESLVWLSRRAFKGREGRGNTGPGQKLSRKVQCISQMYLEYLCHVDVAFIKFFIPSHKHSHMSVQLLVRLLNICQN